MSVQPVNNSVQNVAFGSKTKVAKKGKIKTFISEHKAAAAVIGAAALGAVIAGGLAWKGKLISTAKINHDAQKALENAPEIIKKANSELEQANKKGNDILEIFNGAFDFNSKSEEGIHRKFVFNEPNKTDMLQEFDKSGNLLREAKILKQTSADNSSCRFLSLQEYGEDKSTSYLFGLIDKKTIDKNDISITYTNKDTVSEMISTRKSADGNNEKIVMKNPRNSKAQDSQDVPFAADKIYVFDENNKLTKHAKSSAYSGRAFIYDENGKANKACRVTSGKSEIYMADENGKLRFKSDGDFSDITENIDDFGDAFKKDSAEELQRIKDAITDIVDTIFSIVCFI